MTFAGLIAREDRKYSVDLSLATPIGMHLVHCLTNHLDREIVERACGEVDLSATAFLANLRQGDAAIIGVDCPNLLANKVGRPATPPWSTVQDYQEAEA